MVVVEFISPTSRYCYHFGAYGFLWLWGKYRTWIWMESLIIFFASPLISKLRVSYIHFSFLSNRNPLWRRLLPKTCIYSLSVAVTFKHFSTPSSNFQIKVGHEPRQDRTKRQSKCLRILQMVWILRWPTGFFSLLAGVDECQWVVIRRTAGPCGGQFSVEGLRESHRYWQMASSFHGLSGVLRNEWEEICGFETRPDRWIELSRIDSEWCSVSGGVHGWSGEQGHRKLSK